LTISARAVGLAIREKTMMRRCAVSPAFAMSVMIVSMSPLVSVCCSLHRQAPHVPSEYSPQ
jgi:hypothetical protein